MTCPRPLRVETLRDRQDTLAQLRGDDPGRALTIVGVDGRSGSGKSNLAAAMAELATDVAVVHTDDIAWHHSFFDWTPLLIEHVLAPLRREGAPLSYRPDAWIVRHREGAIAVPADASVVIVEGVGACNRDVLAWLDTSVWIDTDPNVGRQRVVARGVDTEEFIAEWTEQEEAFLAEHRPWAHVDFVVSGETAPIAR
ncbi:hypothetical protein TUM20983_37950 [Mycobacterium antarcticum]|uniref:hypothetical protein n=1 Tax=Mycolicibacterium sp. TUM20983 TaxID=3023369 RepID=UPI002397D877|nr:hypothetical protein [Mycolicibacterium sp. TUM20983]GLP76685.1 hypothetical protein TUM20983_37950 [Mycolicibacterium sp. TUM20983]